MHDRQLSKFLSLLLRHKPETIGITLDTEGWTDIDVLLQKAAETDNQFDKEQLLLVVENNDKKRFEISDDGKKIRAVQGHSNKTVNRHYVQKIPPDTLYHGTIVNFLPAIHQEGLTAQSRHHVHLSHDISTAKKVGGRRGNPVVLSIDSKQMNQDGYEFFQAENGVWLTLTVPPNYINFPE